MNDAARRDASQQTRYRAPHRFDIDEQTSEFGIENEVYEVLLSQRKGSKHPERYILGKPHPDRAKQFKPFAALRGYEELVNEVMANAAKSNDFSKIEESC